MAKNQVVMLAGVAIAVAGLAGLLLSQMMDQASAQAENNNQTGAAPQLKGSVDIQKATNDFIKNNVKVSFADAANTAASQVTDGTVVGGRLSVVQGYLAYTFEVANYNAGTIKIVIIDAGNGSVLYTSNDMQLFDGGLGLGGRGFGQHGGFGDEDQSNGLDKDSSGTTTGTRMAVPRTSL